MERAGVCPGEFGVAQEGLHPDLHRAVPIGHAHGAVVVVAAHEPDEHARRPGARVVGQHRHPLRTQLTGTGPALVGVVRGLEEGEVGPDGRVDVVSHHADGRRAPGLVPVAQHPHRTPASGHRVDEGHRTDPDGAVAPHGDRPLQSGVVEFEVHLERPESERLARPLEVRSRAPGSRRGRTVRPRGAAAAGAHRPP